MCFPPTYELSPIRVENYLINPLTVDTKREY